jgi:SulP family sulfate permease
MTTSDPDAASQPAEAAEPTSEPARGGRPWYHWINVVAGVSVALILIPQSLAYAEIAGVPSYVGLFASALPPIAAAIFASSPYLQTGPVAMTSLLTFGALSTIAAPFTPEYVALAALLALVVGGVRAAIGLLRGGVVAYLMSNPMLVGFTVGAAILICGSQLPKALGVENPEGATILARDWWTLVHPDAWELTAIVISVLTIAIIIGGQRLSPTFPGVLVAVVGAIAYSALTDYSGPTVGEIPSGLPPFTLALPWGRIGELIVPGTVIALVGFAEAGAISRTFAVQDRQRWNPNLEFLSQGAANLASGVSGAFPVGGSFSRSSINRLAGATSKVAGAITGIAVLLFLPIADVLAPLPQAVLGAIVLAAVAKLIRPDRIVEIFRYSVPQGMIALVTFVATLALSPRIDLAVLLGIGLSVLVHLWRELSTHVTTRYDDGVLRIEPAGVMYFGSTPRMAESLVEALADHPGTREVVVDVSRLGRIDYMAAEALKGLVDRAGEAGADARIVGVQDHSVRILTHVFGDRSRLSGPGLDPH